MGNKQSGSYKLPAFQGENWHPVSPARTPRNEYGVCKLYRNNLTNEEVEEYPVGFHNTQEYKKYLEFFQWRQREDNIVNAKFITVEQSSQFCNSTHNALVYIEHIPVRLCNFEDIPYPQNLYVLFSALDGFEKIFYFVGYFQPREDMVCIDRDGKVKVWFNADISRCYTMDNRFADDMNVLNTSLMFQEQMVDEIIQMIERNTSEEIQASMTFTQHLWRNYKGKKLTFKQAKQEIMVYAKKNSTLIPNYFESIMSLIEDQPESDTDPHNNPQQLTQRAWHEEDRIITQNRINSTSPQQLQQLQNQSMVNSTSPKQFQQFPNQTMINSASPQQFKHQTRSNHFHVPQESIMVNSHQLEVRTRAETVPMQSVLGQVVGPSIPVSRPHSPSPYGLDSSNWGRGVSSSAVNVSFNYRPPVSAVPPAPMVPFNNIGNNSNRVIQNTSSVLPPQQQLQSRPVFIPLSPSHPTIPQSPPNFVNHPPIFHNAPANSQLVVSQTHNLQLSPSANQGVSSPSLPVKDEERHSKLQYSDSTQTYELDDEIAKDIIKYFGSPIL